MRDASAITRHIGGDAALPAGTQWRILTRCASAGLVIIFMWLMRSYLVREPVWSAVAAATTGAVLALLLVGHRAPSTGREWSGFGAKAVLMVAASLPTDARSALLREPAATLLAAPIVLHIAWGVARGLRTVGTQAGECAGWRAVLNEILPPTLGKVAAAELAIIGYAFSWTSVPHVPSGSQPFFCHRLLAPAMWAFLGLVVIETTVLHLLVSQWSRTTAWLLFVLSDVSLLYLLGLINSLRRLPTLIEEGVLHVRMGILYDFQLQIASIQSISTAVSAEVLKAPGTIKASLLAYPNVVLEVASPIPSPKPFGKGGPVSRIALALDDPAAFVSALRECAAGST